MSNWEVDQRFEYQGYHRTPAHCWLNVARFGRGGHAGAGTLVIMTELPDSGLSVTNACERIATDIVKVFHWPRGWSLHKTLWVEHYTEEERGRSLGESFDLVSFDWARGSSGMTAHNATWHHITREWVEQLTRFPIDELNMLERFTHA